MDKYLVTGGCGFIGANLVKKILLSGNKVLNVDKLTKASSRDSLKKFEKNKNYEFKKVDICDHNKLSKIIYDFKPRYIMNLAAESHVDNSILRPDEFIKTNIIGTYNLLKILTKNNYFIKNNIKFLHVSTDEVYGSLNKKDLGFKEDDSYQPNSPYSSSKASSDFLVRAWHKTYGLFTITTHCCNNFGPWQHPEKLIPKIIQKCVSQKNIPIYGNGKNIREWISVDDHTDILLKLIKKSKSGDVYNIGSGFEINNLKLTKIIIKRIDKILKNKNSSNKLIKFVKDRKGHDFRYSIDSSKLNNLLGFIDTKNYNTKLFETIDWYLNNKKFMNKK